MALARSLGIAVSIALVTVSAPAFARPDRAEAISVTRALFRHLAVDGICIHRRIEWLTMAGVADDLRHNRRAAGEAVDRASMRAALAEELTFWTIGQGADRPVNVAATQAAVAVAAGPRQPRLLRRVLAEWGAVVPTDRPDCAPAVSSPVFHRDWAFVEFAGSQTAWCFALRRTDGDWRVVASRITTIA